VIGSAEQDAAYDLCERALQIDGKNVLALSIASIWHSRRARSGVSADQQADVRQAKDLVARALALEPDNYWAHYAKAVVLGAQKRHEEVLVEDERSLVLNPSFIPTYVDMCAANLFMGHPEKTIEIADWAIRLSPRDPLLPFIYVFKGLAYVALKEDAQAINAYRRAVAMAPEYNNAQRLLAAALALNGQEAEAREVLQRYLSLPTTQIKTISQWRAFAGTLSDNPAVVASNERLLEGLRKAGMPEE
jgi:tetratricopeptide (TPR) repeat protein